MRNRFSFIRNRGAFHRCAVLCALLLFLLSGCAEENPMKAEVLASAGENRAIAGEYDRDLSVKCRNGVFVGLDTDGVLSFKGIPYAKPPVGDLRWQPPVDAAEGEGVFEAYYFGKSPVQTEWPSEPGSYYPQSEDCLTLNVWVNRNNPAADKPVMVFIHGGSYGWGAASDPIYDGHNLVKKFDDLILVTVEYRLGLYGFIVFSGVPGGGRYPESGNLGLLDQICALRWVRDNIAGFGGDPGNVTIFGESAGGGSVMLLPLIDGTEGLFRRIIAESGSLNLTSSRDECRNLTELLLKETGCSDMAALAALSEADLKKANEALNDYNNFPERDGLVLPEDLYGAFAEKAAGIDFITGNNADEVRYWVNEMGYTVPLLPPMTVYRHAIEILFENNLARLTPEDRDLVERFLAMQSDERIWNLSEFYNELLFRVPALKQAQLHAENGGKAYNYRFTVSGADETLGACHAMELAYVFDNLGATIYTGGRVNEELANTIQQLWVSFARTGIPRADGISWDLYEPDTRLTLILGDEVRMESDVNGEQRELIEPLLRYYFNGLYSQLSLNVPHVYLLAGCAAAVLAVLIIAAAVIVKRIRRRKAAPRS